VTRSSRQAQEAGALATLLEIARILTSRLELRAALERVLEELERGAGIVRGTVMILGEQADGIRMEVSLGPAAEARRSRYWLREGIVGRVVESGRPMVIPAVGREPLLHDRDGSGASRELTFICAPIAVDRRPVGALAVDLKYTQSRDYQGAQGFFGVVASMIAQAFKAHRASESGREGEPQQRIPLSSIVGDSAPMRRAREQIAEVARMTVPVLIRGEAGTGKELIARAVHYHSPRARGPFVRVNVAAVPPALVESELFGYETFNGSRERRRGRFELAEGGTLFVDEVGELNGAAQAKLLRAIQKREFERLGGREAVKADVRLLAASSKDLEAGAFREDLRDLLVARSIFLPPLRDRAADILPLAEHFLARNSRQRGKRIRGISPPAAGALLAHRWAGNVRELENAIEHAVLACGSDIIHAHHLPPKLQARQAPSQASLSGALEQYEKDLILDALRSARGDRARAARLLQTSEKIIGDKMRKHRIRAL
jgi:Nif-specific regulatory protein